MAEENNISEKQFHCALDLFRRLPPAKLETNLTFVTELCPDLAEDLLQTVDCPLSVQNCGETKKDYIICDYNRDGDSYRSPHNNKYYPPIEDGEEGVVPPDNLRKMETDANKIFQIYCDQYYEGGLSSVYFWETEEGFAACVLFKNESQSGARGVEKGVWDAIHVVDVQPNGNKALYKLTTTVILSMQTKNKTLDLSGSIQRQSTMTAEFDEKFNTHIVNMGNLIQKLENQLRDSLETVYFDKAREITGTLRSQVSVNTRNLQKSMADELKSALSNRKR